MGKKIFVAMGLAAMAALAAAPAAIAGVVNSNHDITFKMPAIDPKSGACSFCHIPHKAGGDKLWASSYAAGAGWRAEVISQLCYTCHGTATYTGALNVNPFGTVGKHGRTEATLTGFGDIAALPGDVPVSAADGDLKCTSCHDVHNNDSRPFIRWMPTVGVFDFGAHCEKCHPSRANTIGQETANVVPNATAVNFSQHPTDQAISDVDADGAEAWAATIAAQFAIIGGVQGPGVSNWNLGGHRGNNTATGTMTCATCHAVHGNETADYTAADGGTTVATEVNGLDALAVLSVQPTTVSAAICTGCHANAAISGPGAAGTISHPIDTVSTTWGIGGTLPGPGLPAGAKWGANTGDVLVCQSCHDMHYAQPNTSLLIGPIDGPIATSNSNCNACHGQSTLANHHPSGIAYVNGMAAPVTHTTAFNWQTYAWGTAGPAYVFGAGNIMDCGTCHGGTAGAHNNTGSFPGLASNNTASSMCVDCHSTNPSPYTAMVPAGSGSGTVTVDASHFVGPIDTVGYKRTAVWPTTGIVSTYGTVTANGEIVCESCHTLKTNQVTAMGVSSNTAVAGVLKASVSLLLTNSGNNLNVFNATNAGTNADLCTGCHGGSPTGGTAASGTSTHPTISMGMAVPATAAIIAKVDDVPGTTSLNSASMVNCESCHRPHDAAAGSGALILESAGTDSDKIAGGLAGVIFDRATGNGGLRYTEEATFCNYCHSY